MAANVDVTTYGKVRVTTADDAPTPPYNLLPNKTVNLSFSIENTDYAGQKFVCDSGKKLYFTLKHWLGTNYEFIRSDKENDLVERAFNSGSAGQKNKYQGVFYCNTDSFSSTNSTTFQNQLNTLKTQTGKVWEGKIWDKTTSQDAGGPKVVISPQKTVYQPKDSLMLTVENLPAEAKSARITINGKIYNAPALVSGNKRYPLTIASSDNFTDEGDNAVKVELFDSAGKPVSVSGASFTIKTGTAAPGPDAQKPDDAGNRDAKSQDTTSGKEADCLVDNPDPNKCLFNPLPEDELTSMFLQITKGFLGIIGIWAVMFIIVGGFRMVMAAGNEEQYLAAKKTITWAIIGAVVAILSFSMVAIVQDLLRVRVGDLDKVETQTKK